MVSILVVDDHSVVREGVVLTLEREEDLSVCGEAEDLVQARAILTETPPDLILLDISLSKEKETGLDFLRELRQKENRVPVMVLSMYEEPIYVEKALKEGARGYFLKSESIRSLPEAIRKVMEGKIYLSEFLASTLIENRYSPGQDSIDPASVLSKREMEIFELLALGFRRSQVAEQLFMSVKTVGSHFERMKSKLNQKSLRDLMQFAVSWGRKIGS